jgi:hypothetical protein
VADFGDVCPIAMSFIVFPFPNVLFALLVLPKSISLHHAVVEISHIVLISKFEVSLAMSLVVEKISEVDWAVGESHVALSYFEVQAELSFVDGISGEFYPQTVLHIFVSASEVKFLVFEEDGKIRLAEELFPCKQRLVHFVGGGVRVSTIFAGCLLVFRVDVGDNGAGLFDFFLLVGSILVIHFY